MAKTNTPTSADSATLPDLMTKGQKAASTRKANQAREALRLVKVQAAYDSAVASVTMPTKEQLDREEAEARAEEAANLEAEAAEQAEEAAKPKATQTYVGPMLALRDRAKRGCYQKAPNGQPCSGDEVATILGVLTPEQVIRACIVAMALPGNPYLHLNIGQQSMNLRNKLRGALKRGEFGMGVVREAAEEQQDLLAKEAKAD